MQCSYFPSRNKSKSDLLVKEWREGDKVNQSIKAYGHWPSLGGIYGGTIRRLKGARNKLRGFKVVYMSDSVLT